MKRKLTYLLVVIFSVGLFYACPMHTKNYYPKGYFPDSVTNLERVNSEYDDINMDLLMLFSTNFIIFSSNRNSQGGQYDVVGEPLSFIWDETDGNFSITDNAYNSTLFPFLLQKIKTDADEFGPYNFSYGDSCYLFLASNENGKNNVLFYKYPDPASVNFNPNYDSFISGPYSVPFLSNPDFNEAYVSFQTNLMPFDQMNRIFDYDIFTHIMFSSDSLGQNDIYSIELPQDLNLDSYLTNSQTVTKEYLASVNSSSNDRCPNVCGNFMVFSSDRPGGLGGYDFYYSIYEESEWSEPINFGAPINSAYDEYRAVAIKSYSFENDLLFFSSNRPGGLGGFDIYYVGIDVMPDNNMAY